ncbi:MAG: BMP family ABC transporter substrate-binding protein [Proteobacteria bacterium]|nr:BMP family ABC transporter substrate-binding protein [Pseudomonadota bacterium]
MTRRGALATGGAAILGAAAAGLPIFGNAAFAAGKLVALVHTQAAGDNGPIDDMIVHLKALSKKDHFPIRTIYASDPSTYQSILSTLAGAGAGIIVTTFNEMADPIKAVAPKYPNTTFIQLYADPIKPAMPNVRTVEYQAHYGMFLAGLFGARVSQSRKLGYIGGMSLPGLNADLNAMKAGAAQVASSIPVKGAFAGSFQDPTKGREIANQLFGSGIDFIQTDGAATDAGVIRAASEGSNRIVSAVFRTQFKLGPKTVASSVLVNFGQSLTDQVTYALSSHFAGGHYVSNLADGIIDFVPSPLFMANGPKGYVERAKAAWPSVDAAKQAIIQGKLKVPFNTQL